MEQITTNHKWTEAQHKMQLWSCDTRGKQQTVNRITSIQPGLRPVAWESHSAFSKHDSHANTVQSADCMLFLFFAIIDQQS